MEPCPHPFSGTFLTVVGVYRRLCISIVLFRGILFRGVTIKPIPAVFHIVRFGDVTVEIKILHLVAQVPEVKVSLQLLDSNETLRQLRMVIGVPRGTLGCGLLDQSVYLVLILADNLEKGAISPFERYRPSRIQS